MSLLAPTTRHAANRTRERRVALRVHRSMPLLLLGDGVVAKQLTDTPIAPIPNCASWFRGAARHAGQIVPFFDIAQWAGVASVAHDARVMVVVASANATIGLYCSEPPIILAAGREFAPWPGRHLLAEIEQSAAVAFDPPAWLSTVAPTITDHAPG